ncbi:hypothetical protein NFI95_05595 [Acetobacteraceae bacterium KSS8]|uniref:DUF2029 domain-containing protein n=1 Tax=Endosaccharibacter trunci TaxID=2812733 RepID=A0ABT1W4W0_9PROT|nr:hypothetical protein [Acetobacteraceae bacterium KSS8]
MATGTDTRLRPIAWCVAFLVFAALLFSRQPDALLHAELWGDEGWSFYPDAYNQGWRSLLIPAGGYLDSFQRVVAVLCQPLPLHLVPTAFAAIAFLVQLLPALFLLSERVADFLPRMTPRVVLALLYLLTPNAMELFLNLTNTQWLLALLALLVVIGRKPDSAAGWAFDAAVLTLSGLSGPFALMLLPVSAWRWRQHPSPAARMRFVLPALCAAIQIAVMLGALQDTRSHAPLGAGPRMLAQILAAQVVLASEIGWRQAGPVQILPIWQNNILPVSLTLGAALLVGVALLRGPVALRQAALFILLMLAASLVSPQVSLDRPRWEIMTHMPMGNRYFAFPVMLWMASLVSLLADRSRVLRLVSVLCLLPILFLAIPREWRVLEQARTDFAIRARQFEAAPPGTRMQFPLIPTGITPMQLVKKQAG